MHKQTIVVYSGGIFCLKPAMKRTLICHEATTEESKRQSRGLSFLSAGLDWVRFRICE